MSPASPPTTQQENDYRHLRGLKYHENRLRLLTCVFESITTRVIGQTFNLTCSPDYYRWLEHTRHNWLPMLPTYDPSSQHSVSSQASNLSVPIQFSQYQQSPSSMSISRNDSISDSDMSISRNVSQNRGSNHRDRIRSHSRSHSPDDSRPSQRMRLTYTHHMLTGLPQQYTRIQSTVPPPPHTHTSDGGDDDGGDGSGILMI